MTDRLRKDEWTVAPVSLSTAQALVERHHYAGGGANTATFVHGLFRSGDFMDADCQGVAWWIPPTRTAAEATYSDWMGVLSLSRLVVVPGAPQNAASFLIAGSVRLIPADRWPCLVTYADEWRGHTGQIYRATNWEYLGLTAPEATYVRDGRLIARKAGPKTRTHDEMVSLGAELIGRFAKHKYRLVREAHP